jgi:hypothetical protein
LLKIIGHYIFMQQHIARNAVGKTLLTHTINYNDLRRSIARNQDTIHTALDYHQIASSYLDCSALR